MKTWFAALLLLVTFAAAPALAQDAAAPNPTGVWRTISDADGRPRALVRLQIAPDGELTGVVVGTLREGEPLDRVCARCSGARRNQPIIGMTILWGLRRDARDPALFTGGQVVDPDTGGAYSARLRLLPGSQALELRGFVGVAALGRTQTWRRAP